MRRQLLAAVRMILALTVLLGVLYPLAVTAAGRLTMRGRAEGSLMRTASARVVGSALIGQALAGPLWFHGRPDAFDPDASGPSNLGPLNPDLIADVRKAAETVRRENGLSPGTPLPADAVTTSASGLDPDISLAYARMQAPRVAAARGIPLARVTALIDRLAAGRTFGFLGEPRVNVLALNLALAAAARS